LVSDPASANTNSLQLEAFCLYRALMRDVQGDPDAESNLGGKLLYAGALDACSRAMVIAGNVAGCATLAVAEGSTVHKLAMRDGVVDFVVTSLDEALRIFKNEIRKHAAVAVCVGAAPGDVERELVERGVLPDLVFSGVPGEGLKMPSFGSGAREIRRSDTDPGLAFVEWQVAQAPVRWMGRLDAIAIECLAADGGARRWLRLSPRYSGRDAQAQRALYCDSESARQIIERFAQAVRNGEIAAEVSARLRAGGKTQVFRISPVASE
jgi:urocanate hydratase